MGAITIKIPQNTNGTFEINDPDLAEKMLQELKKSSVTKRPQPAKKDFSELSAWLKKYLASPDPETVDSIKMAEKWRKKWDR